MTLRVLELYCGIGGCATALGDTVEVVAALDVNHRALGVYRLNHPETPVATRTLESLSADDFAGWQADLWWLSPPCQPFTRRGHRRDDRDPRTASLLALLPHLARERPPHVTLENVPGFAGSRTEARLLDTLAASGYRTWSGEICPSELGIPNRRRRYYLVASRHGDPTPPASPTTDTTGFLRPLVEHLDPPGAPAADLRVDARTVADYAHALHRVRATDSDAVTACFTSAYGRSPVRSGSYLVDDRPPDGGSLDGSVLTPVLRRFSPYEILRLLGFPATFRLPGDLPTRAAWRLVGNSLSLPALRRALSGILPALAAGLRR